MMKITQLALVGQGAPASASKWNCVCLLRPTCWDSNDWMRCDGALQYKDEALPALHAA